MKRKTFILLCVILSALFISSCKICVDPKTNPNDPNYNQQEKIDGTYSAKALHYGNIPESYTITIKDEKYNNAKFEKKVLEEDLRFLIIAVNLNKLCIKKVLLVIAQSQNHIIIQLFKMNLNYRQISPQYHANIIFTNIIFLKQAINFILLKWKLR